MSVTIKDSNNTPELIKTLRKLQRKNIKVGVFGADDSEMVMIARVHEFGTEIKVTDKMRGWFAANGYPLKKETTVITIPERSYIRTGYDENVNEITRFIEQMLPDVLELRTNVNLFMDAVGTEFAGMIQKKLRKIQEPDLSDMTKERKKSSNPLIDSGRLVGSIRHEVE